MMIVRLFCPKCAHEASKKLKTSVDIEVPVPVSILADDGHYQVRCGADHVSDVTLDNLKFELLFEMGLNALVDGYPREAVSSFAAALERFQEFYWRVALAHCGVAPQSADEVWKHIAKMSERQMGAYVTAALIMAGSPPPVLNPNKEVNFRNEVIHRGYVPSAEEAQGFGTAVMTLIGEGLRNLQAKAPEALASTYQRLSPAADRCGEENEEEIRGTVNILTAVSGRYPPAGEGPYIGNVLAELDRVRRERQPHKMQLLTDEEKRRRFPEHHSGFGADGQNAG